MSNGLLRVLSFMTHFGMALPGCWVVLGCLCGWDYVKSFSQRTSEPVVNDHLPSVALRQALGVGVGPGDIAQPIGGGTRSGGDGCNATHPPMRWW